MTTWFTRLGIGAFALATLSLNACKKDESQVVLQTAAAPTIAVSTTTPNLVATASNVNATAATFTYTAANFGYSAATTYSLQFDKKGGNFSAPVSVSAGSTGTLALTTAQLIQAFADLDLPYATAAQVDARIVASVGASAPTQVSPVITLSGTPTPICVDNVPNNSWSLIGPAGDGWSSDRNLTYDCYSQTFRLRTTLNPGDFKFRQNNAWAVSLGGSGTDLTKGVTLTSSNGGNLSTTGGTYTVILSVTISGGNVTGGTVRFKK